MARLTAAQRRRLPASAYALPERRPHHGSLPLTDARGRLDHGHIVSAAARLSMMRNRGSVTPAEYRRARARIDRALAASRGGRHPVRMAAEAARYVRADQLKPGDHISLPREHGRSEGYTVQSIRREGNQILISGNYVWSKEINTLSPPAAPDEMFEVIARRGGGASEASARRGWHREGPHTVGRPGFVFDWEIVHLEDDSYHLIGLSKDHVQERNFGHYDSFEDASEAADHYDRQHQEGTKWLRPRAVTLYALDLDERAVVGAIEVRRGAHELPEKVADKLQSTADKTGHVFAIARRIGAFQPGGGEGGGGTANEQPPGRPIHKEIVYVLDLEEREIVGAFESTHVEISRAMQRRIQRDADHSGHVLVVARGLWYFEPAAEGSDMFAENPLPPTSTLGMVGTGLGLLALTTGVGAGIGAAVNEPCKSETIQLFCGPATGAIIGGSFGLLFGGVVGVGLMIPPAWRGVGATAAGTTAVLLLVNTIYNGMKKSEHTLTLAPGTMARTLQPSGDYVQVQPPPGAKWKSFTDHGGKGFDLAGSYAGTNNPIPVYQEMSESYVAVWTDSSGVDQTTNLSITVPGAPAA
jgi:hypothetical protein